MGKRELAGERAADYVEARKQAARAALLLRSALRSALRRKEFTQREMAAACRVTPQYLNDVLRGRRDISLKLAKSFAAWAKSPGVTGIV